MPLFPPPGDALLGLPSEERERFSRGWQSCPRPRSPLCQISFTSFPRMAAHTVCSQQCLSHHQEPPAWGSAELGSVLQRPTKKSRAEAILKFGSPCGGVKETARPAKCELSSVALWPHGLSTLLKDQELLHPPGHQQ